MNVVSFREKVSNLSGKVVIQATVAGNTLLLRLGASPKSETTDSLWLDPPWRILSPSRFIVGSAEFPWTAEDFESQAEYKAEFERVFQLCRCIEGQVIERAVYEPASADLELLFESGLQFRSFSTVGSEEHWRLSEYETKIRYRVSPGIVSPGPFD